jgi:penicillin amidase
VTSSIIPELIPYITENLDISSLKGNERAAASILQTWNASFNLNQVAPTIFTKFQYQFLKNTFEDELGEEGFKQFLNTTLSKRQFAQQIKSVNSVWNDDVTTSDRKETKKDIMKKSFTETVEFLEEQLGSFINKWTWNKVHTVNHKHAIGKGDNKMLQKFFNVGPFPIKGSNNVLNNQMFDLNGNGIYEVKAGPSTRRIIDFSDIENSVAIIPTGQSGNVFSKHYKDQAEKYVKGEFVKMMINKEDIQKLEDKLVFEPK